MRKFLAGAVVAASLAVSGVASAQGTGPWNGAYVGANLGWNRVTAADVDDSISGLGGGLYAGYNFQVSSNVVFGVEGDFNLTRASETVTGTVGGVPASIKSGIDSTWSLRARLGFVAMSNLLIYGTAGYGGAKVAYEETLGAARFKDSANIRGLVVGGGAEYAFTRNVVGRIEGLYTMGRGNGDFDGLDLNVTSIRLGVAYKF